MLRDLGASLWGALVFGFVLIAPGYCFGSGLDFHGFRSRGLREQLAWSVALSFGVGTLFVVALVWLTNVTVASALLVLVGVFAGWTLSREKQWRHKPKRSLAPFAIVALVTTLIAVVSLTDIGISHRLWMSVTAYDLSLRTAFVDAVMRTGVPPANPAYWPGHDAPMRYYYFWYVICAVVARLAGISARQALTASSVWPFFGLAAMLALYGRYMLEWRGRELQRRWWLAVALVGVTGLDLLVVIFVWLVDRFVAGDLEWWSIDQVSSWTDTFLWVPHHAAALVCCLLCVLLVWLAAAEKDKRRRLSMSVVAGIAFASSFGLSIYVAAATAFVVLLWVGWRMFYADRSRAVTAALIAGAVSAIVLAPYLFQLLRPQAGASASAGHVLAFGVRRILLPTTLYGFPGLRSLQFSHPPTAANISALLLLVPSYGVELGFFGVVLLAAQRKRAKQPGEDAVLFFAWAGLISASFLRSQVIATNDYGIRATLLPQFMLLLLAVIVLQRSARLPRFALLFLVCVGAAGTLYQLGVLKLYLPLREAHSDPKVRQLAGQNYALRDAYAAFHAVAPVSARVQYSVRPGDYYGYSQLLNVGRQIITNEDKCNASFGGELTPCAKVLDSVGRIFPAVTQATPSAQEARVLCSGIGAEYLIATALDAAWNAPEGWVWRLPVVVERPDVRIVRCATATR